MARRCPVCKEVLLTLRVGDLERCERCDHFVDPGGVVVAAREGRIRNALSGAGDEPHTVAELEAMLGSRDPDELRELCERHRERVRRQIDALELPEDVGVERVDATPGAYREPSTPGRVRVTFAKPSVGPSDRAKKAAQIMMVIAGFVVLVSTCVAVTAPADHPEVTVVVCGGLFLIFLAGHFAGWSGRPIRQLVLEDGQVELEAHLVGRTGQRTVRLPVRLHRIGHTFRRDEGSRTYLRFQGPSVDEYLMVVHGDEATGRAAVIRLEDALRLSGPAPSQKKQ